MAFQVRLVHIYSGTAHYLHIEFSFQRGSPYLQDSNYLIDLMNQMDLEFSTNRLLNFLPNSTKCMTWHDVKASHETDNPKVFIRMNDILGMLILLSIGLGGAFIVFTMELLMRRKRSIRNGRATQGKYIFKNSYIE